MWQAIKNVILWNYGRTTWQYDVLCILILAFIFLTPPSWFTGRERAAAENPKITRLIVSPESFSPETDENARLIKVRELSGNPAANIAAWREKRDAKGKLTAYEIDLQ